MVRAQSAIVWFIRYAALIRNRKDAAVRDAAQSGLGRRWLETRGSRDLPFGRRLRLVGLRAPVGALSASRDGNLKGEKPTMRLILSIK
jgi:hypothetical protein